MPQFIHIDGVPELEHSHIDTVTSNTDSSNTTRDCGSIGIGAADTDRLVVVVIETAYAEITGFNITGVTIGGVSVGSNYRVQYSAGYNNATLATIIAWRKIPTGTSANVSFTHGSTVSIRHHTVNSYRIIGSADVAYYAQGGGTGSSANVSAEAGGVVIVGGAGRGAGATVSLSGATANDNRSVDSLARHITGSKAVTSDGTQSISASWSGVEGSQQCLLSVSFSP